MQHKFALSLIIFLCVALLARTTCCKTKLYAVAWGTKWTLPFKFDYFRQLNRKCYINLKFTPCLFFYSFTNLFEIISDSKNSLRRFLSDYHSKGAETSIWDSIWEKVIKMIEKGNDWMTTHYFPIICPWKELIVYYISFSCVKLEFGSWCTLHHTDHTSSVPAYSWIALVMNCWAFWASWKQQICLKIVCFYPPVHWWATSDICIVS